MGSCTVSTLLFQYVHHCIWRADCAIDDHYLGGICLCSFEFLWKKCFVYIISSTADDPTCNIIVYQLTSLERHRTSRYEIGCHVAVLGFGFWCIPIKTDI